jgi:hypothetical protein
VTTYARELLLIRSVLALGDSAGMALQERTASTTR